MISPKFSLGLWLNHYLVSGCQYPQVTILSRHVFYPIGCGSGLYFYDDCLPHGWSSNCRIWYKRLMPYLYCRAPAACNGLWLLINRWQEYNVSAISGHRPSRVNRFNLRRTRWREGMAAGEGNGWYIGEWVLDVDYCGPSGHPVDTYPCLSRV